MVRKQLMPGVWLTAIESRKFKTGCFSVNLFRPLCHAEAAKNALIPAVLLRGCRRYPDIRSITIKLDELYGAAVGSVTRKKGETQVVGLYADYVEDALVSEPIFAGVTEFVRQLLFEPLTENGGFLEEFFQSEKENLLHAMASELNDKRVYATRRLLKNMCADEPYGLPSIGEEKDLEGLTAQTLLAHYRELLATSQVELFYMGRADKQNVSERFLAMLSELPRRERIALPKVPTVTVQKERFVEETMPLSQSKLCIGCRAPIAESAQELAALLVFNVIYGAGTNCKLFLKVREEQSLCYYASASYDKYKGFLLISSGIDAQQLDAARSEILRQLSACAAGDFTAQDLALAKSQLISQLKTDLDNPSRLEEYYVGLAASGRSESVETLMSAIERVTAEQAQAAAASVRPDTVYFLKGVSA